MNEDCARCRADVEALRKELLALFAEKDRTLDARFAGSDRIHEERVQGLSRWIHSKLEANQLAIDKAEQLIKEKMLAENNIREELRDQAGTFATMAWVDLRLSPLSTDVAKMTQFIANWQGRATVWALVWGFLVVGFAIGLSWLLKGAH